MLIPDDIDLTALSVSMRGKELTFTVNIYLICTDSDKYFILLWLSIILVDYLFIDLNIFPLIKTQNKKKNGKRFYYLGKRDRKTQSCSRCSVWVHAGRQQAANWGESPPFTCSSLLVPDRRTPSCSTCGTSAARPACRRSTSASSRTRPCTWSPGTWPWVRRRWPTCRRGCSTSRWTPSNCSREAARSCFQSGEGGGVWEPLGCCSETRCLSLQWEVLTCWFTGKLFRVVVPQHPAAVPVWRLCFLQLSCSDVKDVETTPILWVASLKTK